MKYLIWKTKFESGVIELDSFVGDLSILFDRLKENLCEMRIYEEADLANAAFGVKQNVNVRMDKEATEERVREALKSCDWAQNKAAYELGITPRAINYYINKFGITHEGWKRNGLNKVELRKAG